MQTAAPQALIERAGLLGSAHDAEDSPVGCALTPKGPLGSTPEMGPLLDDTG